MLIKTAEDYQLQLDNKVKNFTEFTKGFCLAHSCKIEYHIKKTGDAIVFPNDNVPVGQRAGLVVRKVKMHELPVVTLSNSNQEIENK